MIIPLEKKQNQSIYGHSSKVVNNRTTGIRCRVNTEKLIEPAKNYDLPNLVSPLSSQLDWLFWHDTDKKFKLELFTLCPGRSSTDKYQLDFILHLFPFTKAQSWDWIGHIGFDVNADAEGFLPSCKTLVSLTSTMHERLLLLSGT